MFMIKTIIRQALSQTCVNKYPKLTSELATEFLEKASPKPVSVNRLTHILELVEESDVRDTISIPDVFVNSIFDIVLPSIKIVSYYDLFKHPNPLEELLVARFSHDLVSLLEK